MDVADDALDGRRIGVIGAGIGGLSAAAYLGAAGADVTVYERTGEVGGVAGRLERDGFRFDTGPSWYLMPEVFERFFGHFGHEPAEWYDLVHLDPHYRVFWTDGDRADVPADVAAARELFERYEPGAGDALAAYLEEAEAAYEIGMERFVYPGRSRLRDYASLDVARSARGLSFLGSMADHVDGYFDHPKLRQLVEYTLVFLGGSPHNTPALYTLMSHVDYRLGVYYPMGGMRRVVEAVRDVAREEGATIETDAPVAEVDPSGKGTRLGIADGRTGATGDDAARSADRTVDVDAVVSDAPAPHVERDLLPASVRPRGEGYWADRTYAPSAFLLYLGVEGDVDPLGHHTLVLPEDWDDHFAAIFDDPAWPDRPAYYVNVPSETDPEVAPEGCETVVVLVPIAPGLDDGPERRAAFRDRILADLAAYTGVDLRGRIRVEESACVSEFAERFNAPGGSALGLAHTLRQTGPLRPGQRVRGVDGLYYVGQYANPGVGVPMCLLSGEHAAEAVAEDLGAGGGSLAAGLLDRLA